MSVNGSCLTTAAARRIAEAKRLLMSLAGVQRDTLLDTLGYTRKVSEYEEIAFQDAINLEAPAGGVDVDAALQINVASSQAAATAIQLTASDAAGGITATVGTGNYNVSGGNLKIASTGKGLQVKGGVATDFVGTAVLILGTVTVANTNIATGDLIFLSRVASNGSVTLGIPTYTISNGASFTITSLVIGTPASTQTADVSSIAYFIVRPV